ncbi:MAG: penicillin-binding protein 2, partial [Alphaproteobacteria bacterium]|nr:penicillin-binding protein 2 [Alphaproteobacteria bacterium]
PSPHRVYPTGATAAHITGFADADMQHGLSGLEQTLDKIEPTSSFTTTLDIRVQHIMRDALLSAMAAYKTKAAAAAIMNIHNGEIIALVSLPDFDANKPQASPTLNQFNRMTFGVYELGSIFKIFTAAMALESGAVTVTETFETSQPLQIGGYQITDIHGQDHALTIDEIVAYSSNIGSALLALRVPAQTHYDFLADLSFTEPLYFDLPETAHPIFPTRWTDIERATSSFGHGLAITPLHALVATAAMVNGGVLYPPSLRRIDVPVGRRVISADTSAHLRRIMRSVISDGTGRKADVEGYPMLGKTGSANKPQDGKYSDDALVTSFVGAFPAQNPRYALMVMLDEPQGTDETFGFSLAGWNAAPVAAEIISRAALFLGVMPSRVHPQAKTIGGADAS